MLVRETPHLHQLVTEAQRAAGMLDAVAASARAQAASDALRAAARLSLRLDASPLDDATADAEDARRAAGLPPPGVESPPEPQNRGWGAVLKLDGMATAEVAALEYRNVLEAHARLGALVPLFAEQPLEALAQVHRQLTAGLLDPDRAGTPRRTDQAVHDGAQGKVIHRPPAPEDVGDRLAALERWLAGDAGSLPAVVRASVLHEQILELQPYEAANGRLARAALRLSLRASGIDADGLAVPEAAYLADALGYHAEVAATVRRRDLGPWVERDLEALGAALRTALRVLAPGSDDGPAEDAALPTGTRFTLAEYARHAGVDLAEARARLAALVARGCVEHEPGARGLAYRPVPS